MILAAYNQTYNLQFVRIVGICNEMSFVINRQPVKQSEIVKSMTFSSFDLLF